jgi:hypothetical protein
MELGKRRWVIADGYIPSWSHGPEPEMESHDSASFVNTGEREAHVEMWMYFRDRDPAGPYRLTVPARRTLHQRLNELENPEPLPRGKEYACVIESDVPVVVQHTRLDSRQARASLMTTVAYAE